MERVVITGYALATPAGSDPDAVWEKVSRGICDGHYRGVALPDERSVRAGRIPGGSFRLGRRDPHIEMAVACAETAVAHAGLRENGESLRLAGITVSSSKGGMRTLEAVHAAFLAGGPGSVSRDFIPEAAGGGAGAAVAARLGAGGPIVNCVSACATGAHAIMLGASWIRDGEAPVVVAGSSEASLTPTVLAAFGRMGVLAESKMRPFDRRRDGFLPGEGCGVVVLESLASARRRGAGILCELSGWASRADAYHVTSMNPDGGSIARAVATAIGRAGLTPVELDYINAHGTATPQNDVIETRGIRAALGGSAADVSISSTKPVTGHLLGAAGPVELILTAMAMERGFVPPTVGLEEADPACDLDYTPLEGRRRNIENAVSLSYGFGGHVAALVISKMK